MKKYILLLMICLTFSYVKAQTILVNSNVISVHEDVTFPLWLDSMSTIEIGTQVVSISALEFNIVPATNGNSLIFSQTKTITSQQTVPNGTTWKITAVLLDSTTINNSSSSSGAQVIVSGSGGSVPVALSEESSNMTFGAAMLYCDGLLEDGYDNWVIPTYDEIRFIASGGGIVPGTRTNTLLWTTTNTASCCDNYIVDVLDGYHTTSGVSNSYPVRCIRSESISVSSSSSGSSSSSSSSTSGGGYAVVALSEESPNNMSYGDAMAYCDSLNEGGYHNWVMPSLNELEFLSSGGSTIPGSRTTNLLWTNTSLVYAGNINNKAAMDILNGSGGEEYYTNSNYVRCARHESVSVSGSGSGSSSGGSNTASILGSGMPTMISHESQNNMTFSDAMLYCDSLSEAGYNDWIMPNFDQLSYVISGGCVIPDSRTEDLIWSRSFVDANSTGYVKMIKLVNTTGYSIEIQNTHTNNSHKCRCVR